VDDDFVTKLQTALKEAMKSPLSNSTHRLGALLFMAETKGIPIEIPNALIDVLKEKLLEPNNNFAVLASKMSSAQIDALLPIVLEKLDDSEEGVGISASDTLSAFLVNSSLAHDYLIEYSKTHPASTVERHVLNIILDTYTAIYTPSAAPSLNMGT